MLSISRRVAVALFVLVAVPAAGAKELVIPPAKIPKLADFAPDTDLFVPKGWKMEAQASGDLRKDGNEDHAVFVLREDNPKNVLKNTDGFGAPEIDTNPRILCVALREGAGYRLIVQDAHIIPRHTVPTMDDAFDAASGLKVANGAFSLTLNSFSSAGSWEMGSAKLTFRFQNGHVELIGWDRTSVMRNSGEVEERSANFSTGVLEITTGNIEHDRKKISRKKLAMKPIPIDRVGDGLAFGSGAEGGPDVK